MPNRGSGWYPLARMDRFFDLEECFLGLKLHEIFSDQIPILHRFRDLHKVLTESDLVEIAETRDGCSSVGQYL